MVNIEAGVAAAATCGTIASIFSPFATDNMAMTRAHWQARTSLPMWPGHEV
jgi:hypothetical protein